MSIRREAFGFEASPAKFSIDAGFLGTLDTELRNFTSAYSLHQRSGIEMGNMAVEDLLIVFKTLRFERGATRCRIRSLLQNQLTGCSDVCLDLSIDLAACLLTMLNIRDVRMKLQTPQTPVIQWNDGTTLEALVTRQFPLASWSVSSREGRLRPEFTAAWMVRICDLKISWTTCLADHLRLDPSSRVLKVFPYKQSLLDHLEGLKKHNLPAIIPETVLTETIQSLDLLFPHWDFRTNKLLKKHSQSFHQIGPFPSSRKLNLCEFEHWRDRLAELYEEVYCYPPASWAQLWADRRNPQQWYTFWIALLILLLTIMSTLVGIVQAWASVRSLQLAMEAFRNM